MGFFGWLFAVGSRSVVRLGVCFFAVGSSSIIGLRLLSSVRSRTVARLIRLLSALFAVGSTAEPTSEERPRGREIQTSPTAAGAWISVFWWVSMLLISVPLVSVLLISIALISLLLLALFIRIE